MERRVVTPYSDPPDIATLESLDTDVEVEMIQWQGSKDGASRKGKSKRRRSRNKSISEDKGCERKLSVASDISLEDYSSEPTSPRSDIEQVRHSSFLKLVDVLFIQPSSQYLFRSSRCPC